MKVLSPQDELLLVYEQNFKEQVMAGWSPNLLFSVLLIANVRMLLASGADLGQVMDQIDEGRKWLEQNGQVMEAVVQGHTIH